MTWDEIPLDRPFTLYRLIHDVLGSQVGVDPNLADLTLWKWQLARAGIATHIVRERITFADVVAQEG